MHFFRHDFSLPAHQGLQYPVTAAVVLVAVIVIVIPVVLLEMSVVRVTVSVVLVTLSVLGITLPLRQEQQGSLAIPSAQRLHSNTPPCDAQAVICASHGHAGSGSRVGEGVGSGSGSGVGSSSGVGSGSEVGSGSGVGAGCSGVPKHCEYQGFDTTQPLPASQHVGPAHPIPPHWPHIGEQGPGSGAGTGVGVGAGPTGTGVGGGAGVGSPDTTSMSMQDTKISSVYLQTHNHRSVAGPAAMPVKVTF